MFVFVWVYAYECRWLRNPEEGASSSETGVTGGCKLPDMGAESTGYDPNH